MEPVEYEGFLIDFNESLFEVYTDTKGREVILHKRMWWDPNFHKAVDAYEMGVLIEWWLENREAIFEQNERLFRRVGGLFEQYTGFHVTSSSLAPVIRRELERFYPGSVLEITHNNGSPGQGFLLVPSVQEENSDLIKVEVSEVLSHGELVVRSGDASTGTSSRWNEVLNYSFRMDPDEHNFFRRVSHEDSPMMGMELEVSSKITAGELQHIVTDVEPKQEPFFIFKDDSSISGKYPNRYELVTVPCTPRYLRKHWKLLFQKLETLVAAKGKSIKDFFDCGFDLSNGIHIHVDKRAFTTDTAKRKFLTAFNQFDKGAMRFINEIAKRPNGIIGARYCDIGASYDGRTLARRLSGRGINDNNRAACHASNSKTLEVRVFQGIFDIKHIMQCISFTEAMVNYAHECPIKGFDGRFKSEFSRYVNTNRKYASLWDITGGKKACA